MTNRKVITEEMKQKWREQEAQGMKRGQIADLAGYSKSAITRALGAVRPYREKRREA